MVETRVQVEPTLSDAHSFIIAVKEAFHDEPTKYEEFIKLMLDIRDHSVDKATGIQKMTELIKGHPRLLRRLSFFFPQVKRSISPKDNSTIHHEAKATNPPEAEHCGAKSKYTIRKRIERDWENFMNMLKTRFRSLDTHVVESFLKIMIMHNEGKMSEKEVKEEVIDLLFYHEDLIDKFFRYFNMRK
ncbi:Paired amphipathic helix [Arabidopsis thaliana x Arabidopsis arenosa]|uniref:Paired amphipathic helix n=1 Tax=Arabidopsis thaliana x Arabidopsis arenosa TaxID=1240361 RepID=A0A8T2BYH3_9BRAS|nr:Paired amphipathic helix [Arabidopsis thaliana x Arabidopsis arenosa]